MKKIILFCILSCITISIFAKVGDIKYIAVETIEIKSSTGFFSKEVGTATYGDEVIVLSEKGKWTEVQLKANPSIKGWVSQTSLTSKRIVKRNDKTVTTSADELALAGKGFSQEVEDFYKEQNSIDFSLVDDIENVSVSDTDLLNFITNGKLNGDAQ